MTALSVVLWLCVVAGALAGFSYAAARWIEAIAPPQGGFLEIDGRRLHVLDEGAGPPLVLIHGLSGQMGNFTHSLVARLTPDFRVVAFDRPGSGYSTVPWDTPPDFHAQAAILAKAIRALKLDRPTIVGHSYGGVIALALALEHPDCVGALALIAPVTHPVAAPPAAFRALAIGSPVLRRLFAWTLATPVGLLANRWADRAVFAPEPAARDFGVRGGGLIVLRPGNIYATSTELIAGLAYAQEFPMAKCYPSLRIPVGILYGRGDRVLDWREHGERMKALAPSVDLEILDGGHMLPVTQPDLCAAFIRRIWAKAKAR